VQSTKGRVDSRKASTHISGLQRSIQGQREGSGSFLFLAVLLFFGMGASGKATAADLRFVPVLDDATLDVEPDARVAVGMLWIATTGSDATISTEGERADGIMS
jgi:hypothetical protein